MLEKYELTTPRLYADSDDENEMRLSKVAASGGDRRVIHRPSGGIKNCPESEVDSMLLRKSSDSTTPLPSFLGRPLCCKGIENFKGTVLASSSRKILSSPLRYDLIYYSRLGEREGG